MTTTKACTPDAHSSHDLRLFDEQSVKFTTRYCAPELIDEYEAAHTFRSDIWALGCLVYEVPSHVYHSSSTDVYSKLLTDIIPYSIARNECNLIVCILKGKLPADLPSPILPRDISKLLASCWRIVPFDRPVILNFLQSLRTSEQLQLQPGSQASIQTEAMFEPQQRAVQNEPGDTATSTSQPPPRQHHLYDPRREDPIRFTVLTRSGPAPGSSQLPPYLPLKHLYPSPPLSEYVSASATSLSDAQTLASNTPSSSASNPYSPASGKELGGKARWLEQMKGLYRQIIALEKKILEEGDFAPDGEELETMSASQPQSSVNPNEETRWTRLVSKHKMYVPTSHPSLTSTNHHIRRLADLYYNFLSFALKPEVPASLQTLPSKYDIPARMWNVGFQRLLVALRRASISSQAAREQLESLIIYAYGFYTALLEEEHLAQLRVLWLEALGDLSRYQMAVVAHPDVARGVTGDHLTLPMDLAVNLGTSPDVSRMEGDSPLPSVDAPAAAELEMEDDRELWRRNAREWYTKGIQDQPSQGRLHHHLGLVSADAEGEELRAVYHFARRCDLFSYLSTCNSYDSLQLGGQSRM